MEKTVNQSKGEVPPAVIREAMGTQQQTTVKRPRPANGFLGFCHRHRPIVSTLNPKLENRLVTKILGSWWTSLRPDQRKVYEDRAREYKAVFMAANPGYKWYTRPESTGNTPVTRQSNRRGRKLETDIATSTTAITPGKLADESQMGNLSSLMHFTDHSKKRSLEMANYIASEHDYLQTKPYFLNNNSIISVETPLEQCMTDGWGARTDETNAEPKPEEHNVDSEEDSNDDLSIDTADEEKGEEEGGAVKEQKASSASKRKMSKPRKKPIAEQTDGSNLKELPECPCFKEFMTVCPIYSYEDFMDKKAETNSAHKAKMMKRRRWAAALLEYGDDGTPSPPEEGPPPRRRRKRRIGAAPRGPKRPRSAAAASSAIDAPEPCPSPPEERAVVQQATLAICPTPYGPSIPNFNHLDLLVCAAETLEKCWL